MRKIQFLFSFFLITLLSCKNELKLNAEWKDITIVYGLLNQYDTIQYLKINKAFLGEGNALLMAQVPDSSSYFNNLQVSVEEWENNILKRTIVFDTTTIYNKEPGTFYYPKQLIYKSKAKLDLTNNENIEYHLKIHHKITGKDITSKTKLIGPIALIKPLRYQSNPIIGISSSAPADIILGVANNSKYYQVYFRFKYVEENKITHFTEIKHCDIYVGEAVTNDYSKEIKLAYIGTNIYKGIRSFIKPDPNLKRMILNDETIDLAIYAANDNFYTYIQSVKPSTGITMEKPEYTNIDNGIGIFASRITVRYGFNLNAPSLDSLYDGNYTKDLGFTR